MALAEVMQSSPERGMWAGTNPVAAESAQLDNVIPLLAGGFLFGEQDVPADGLYMPVPGVLEERFAPRKVKGGELFIGTYHTDRDDRHVSHPIGIYRPDGYDPATAPPPVIKTSPLGTGTRIHNPKVALDFIDQGESAVIFKSAPRYDGPRTALGLAEDANEMLGLAQAVNTNSVLGNFDRLLGYGESQAAMKLFALSAIAGRYGFKLEDMLAVAPCYIDAIDLSRPLHSAGHIGGMALSAVRHAKNVGLKETWELRRVMSRKDLHHHLAVIPVLLSGETGEALPYVPKDQKGLVVFFERDGSSDPENAVHEVKTLTSLRTKVIPEYGHVDGIMSPDVRLLRGRLVMNAARRQREQSA